MAHLTSQELVPFLGLLSSSHIDEDAERYVFLNAAIRTLSPCRNPTNYVAEHYSEVDLEVPSNRTGCFKRGANSVTIRRMNIHGELLE